MLRLTGTGCLHDVHALALLRASGEHLCSKWREIKMQLAKSAMLVSANIVNGGLLGERRDNVASLLVENTYNTAHRRTKASKYLIDRKHKSVRQVVAASQRVREIIYRYTLPWGDDKSRLLSVKLLQTFREKLNPAIIELKEGREDYIQPHRALVGTSELD